MWGCGRSGANRGKASRNCGSAKKGTGICGSCWCRERTGFWAGLGPDTDLKRWGLKLAGRGGKNAKKRAVVAVARKLAILLHRLWVTGEVYEPLRNSQVPPLKAIQEGGSVKDGFCSKPIAEFG